MPASCKSCLAEDQQWLSLPAVLVEDTPQLLHGKPTLLFAVEFDHFKQTPVITESPRTKSVGTIRGVLLSLEPTPSEVFCSVPRCWGASEVPTGSGKDHAG